MDSSFHAVIPPKMAIKKTIIKKIMATGCLLEAL